MSVLGRLVGAGAVVSVLALGVVRSAAAQGVTTAAVRGTITREGGLPIDNAVITLINTPKGTSQRVTTSNGGRYSFENVESGGPYTLEARAIGFEPTTKTGISLILGQRYIADFELKAHVVMIAELSVTAMVDPLINSARTGPQTTIGDSAISRLPLLGRNFTSLLATSPQVTGSSIAGQNNRFNSIQIDGAVNNDVFGLSSGGTPGGTAGVKPLSVEAIKEFQILVAPFDIRQGGFTGGLVNAVTKSGTNTWSGSLFGYLQNQDLVGKDTAGLKVTTFKVQQYGGTFGGPIIKDKVHFFVSADIQGRNAPFFGLEVSEPSTGITQATADRVTKVMRDKYGFDPGTYEAPNLETPNKNFFGKLSAQLGGSNRVELTYNYNDGFNDVFNRTNRTQNFRDGWQLSNSGYQVANTTNAARGKWIGQFGKVSTEVIGGYQTVRDIREMPNVVPLAMVQGDIAGNYLAAGGERFSHGNQLDQNILELTANATIDLGRHQVTVGTHNERLDFLNVFWQARYGVWTFNNVTDLENAVPNRYEIILPTAQRPDGPVATFGATQLGGYVQDQWSPNDRLTITGGLRMDVPISDKPVTNEALLNTAGLNINTGNFPTGNLLIAPRLGFNWDVSGNGSTVIRGGVGVFSGRPPYVWMSNNFANTGLEQATLTCSTAATMPTFTMDITKLPTTCAGGGAATPPIPLVVYTDENFKFQQALKYSIGVDHKLPAGIVGSLDFLYTKNLNDLYPVDVNLVAGTSTSEERAMYGTIGATGSATRNRVSTAYSNIIQQGNKSGAYAALMTAQLAKRFGGNLEFNAAYTYQKVRDYISNTSSQSQSNVQFATIDGDIYTRNLRPSVFDVPHKITLAGTANVPLGFAMSLIYTGTAGAPYAYVTTQDANADGFSGNDPIYIPTSATDITLADPAAWDRLNIFIAGQACLNENRGALMQRGSCRNPWFHFVDFRLAKRIQTFGHQSMEITGDIFNLLNLINSDWGLNRSTTFNENLSGLMGVAGWDAANNRPKYSVPTSLPARDRVSVGSSRWRIQLGLKYVW